MNIRKNELQIAFYEDLDRINLTAAASALIHMTIVCLCTVGITVMTCFAVPEMIFAYTGQTVSYDKSREFIPQRKGDLRKIGYDELQLAYVGTNRTITGIWASLEKP